MPVQLPEGKDPAKTPEHEDGVSISITYEGPSLHTLYYQDDPQSPERLEALLRELNARAPSTPVTIKADKRLSYGVVRDVMRSCEATGFRGVALVAETPRS